MTDIASGWTEAAPLVVREGKLLYAGKAETGFKTEDLYRLRERLDPHVRASSPLAVPIDKPKATWVVVQAEVEYSAFTSGGRLRAPVYKGSRDDLAPRSSGARREGSQHRSPAARSQARTAAQASIKPRSMRRPTVPKENILQRLPQAVAPTKAALQAYWQRVHSLALPHLARRPLKLVRNVGGIVFYHKGPLPKIPARSISCACASEKRERADAFGSMTWKVSSA